MPAALVSPREEMVLVPGDIFERQVTYSQRGGVGRGLCRDLYSLCLTPSRGPEIPAAPAQDVPRQRPLARPFQGQTESPAPTPSAPHNGDHSRLRALRGWGQGVVLGGWAGDLVLGPGREPDLKSTGGVALWR